MPASARSFICEAFSASRTGHVKHSRATPTPDKYSHRDTNRSSDRDDNPMQICHRRSPNVVASLADSPLSRQPNKTPVYAALYSRPIGPVIRSFVDLSHAATTF